MISKAKTMFLAIFALMLIATACRHDDVYQVLLPPELDDENELPSDTVEIEDEESDESSVDVPEIDFALPGLTALVYDGKTLVSWKPMEEDVSFDSVLILRDGAVVAEVLAEKSGCAIAESRAGVEYALAVKAGGNISEKRISVASVEPGLPVIEVTTLGGEEPTCEHRNAPAGGDGVGIYNATKVPGRLVMTSGSETWYDSGEYDEDAKKGMTIKIRGNTSALSAKKPYKIKLQKEAKADLLAKPNGRAGGKFEERDWILLKDGTSLNTFVGMTVADIAGTEWTPEFAFVNLVVNDNYRGVYLLIESISQGKGRINVDKDTGYIIELDAYWWNEEMEGNPIFKTNSDKGFTFKYPDEDDIEQAQIEYIKNYMNDVEDAIADGTYGDLIETETFARWLLVHDLLGTWDSGGSNIYMTKYDNTLDSKIRMSTPWDFDSNYDMEKAWARIHNSTRYGYFPSLLASANTEFLDSYKAQWAAVKGSVQRELSAELSALQARQGGAINASRRLDAARWGGTYTSVEANISTAEQWFAARIPWLEANIGAIPLADE